jgi:MFS family permease
MLTYAIVAAAERMCLPVLFNEISADLGLNLVSVGAIWGIDPLAGIFIGLPAGLLADRFGIKRTLTVICLLAGVLSALRGFSFNFITLAATTFLFGMVASMTPSIVPKTTAVWFSRSYLGITNALLQCAWSVGSHGCYFDQRYAAFSLARGLAKRAFFPGSPGSCSGTVVAVHRTRTRAAGAPG